MLTVWDAVTQFCYFATSWVVGDIGETLDETTRTSDVTCIKFKTTFSYSTVHKNEHLRSCYFRTYVNFSLDYWNMLIGSHQ